MTAQIIPFSVRDHVSWPGGQLGEEMEKLAELGYRAVLRRGERDTMEKARRRVLAAVLETDRLLTG